MAKFRESGYVNDFVTFRNACEERKLKYTLSHIDKMKLSYNRQQDKEKLFFAVQYLSVPVNRRFPNGDVTSRSRSNSAPLQNYDKGEPSKVPINETLLTKRRSLTGEEEKATTIKATELKQMKPELNDDHLSSSIKETLSPSLNLPQICNPLATSSSRASSGKKTVKSQSGKDDTNTQHHKTNIIRIDKTQQIINNSPVSMGTHRRSKSRDLLSVDFSGGGETRRDSSVSNRRRSSRESIGSSLPDDGCPSFTRDSSSSCTSRHESIHSDTSEKDGGGGSNNRARLKKEQDEKNILSEMIKRKKKKKKKNTTETEDEHEERRRINGAAKSKKSGLTLLPAKEEWRRRLDTMKQTNHDLTDREKQALEQKVRNKWKNAFENMKTKRLSLYQDKMANCSEDNSKTFVKFLPKSKQAFYIKDVQFAQKFL